MMVICHCKELIMYIANQLATVPTLPTVLYCQLIT